jgi:hypothetical protein
MTELSHSTAEPVVRVTFSVEGRTEPRAVFSGESAERDADMFARYLLRTTGANGEARYIAEVVLGNGASHLTGLPGGTLRENARFSARMETLYGDAKEVLAGRRFLDGVGPAHSSAEALWAQLHDIDRYPPGVQPVPKPIEFTAFFPGGYGVWGARAGKPVPPIPRGGIMVVGQDFYTARGYRQIVRAGEKSLIARTWTHLRELLEEVGIDLSRCFFTNAYMGLRNGGRNVGEFPGARDAAFVEVCRQFFREQLRAVAPRCVLTLGRFVPGFMAPLSPQLACWDGVRSLRTLDAAGTSLITAAEFPDVLGSPVVMGVLVHPSFRPRTVASRRYAGTEGDAAEIALVRAALSAAQL